jgi:hypothetical protein
MASKRRCPHCQGSLERYEDPLAVEIQMTMQEQIDILSTKLSGLAKDKWASSKQRDELKRCPFCDTIAIEQARLADNSTDMHWRISCGNPFCSMECRTIIFSSKRDAEEAWQERSKS